MPKRSPILGYNHNVRHRGVVFHVQTEDSGVDNPHLFTHLFHGGTILSSRRLDYDAESAEDVVKSLMQSQHKAMLKDLRSGNFEEKIDRYLLGNPALQPLRSGPGLELTDTAPVAQAITESGLRLVEEVTAAERLADVAGSTERVSLPPDTATTQEIPVSALEEVLVDTDAPTQMIGEESDATIRISLVPGLADEGNFQPPGLAMPEAKKPSEPASSGKTTAYGMPPIPAAAKRPSKESGVAGPREDVHGAPAARAVGTALPSEPLSDARRRLAPGAVEFRAPTGDTPRPKAAPSEAERQAASGDSRLSDGVPDHRPLLDASESELSEVFKSMGLESNEATLERPLVAKIAKPAGKASAQRNRLPSQVGRDGEPPKSLYIHTRTGRVTSTPEDIDDDPTGRQDKVPRSTRITAAQGSPILQRPGSAGRPNRGDVLVSKPAVIVGGPPKRVGVPSRPLEAKQPPRRAREGSRSGLFGKDLISEKSLDEVILAYLSEDSDEK